MAVTGMRLYGIVQRPERGEELPAPRTGVVCVRDLAALVRAAPYEAVAGDADAIADYRAVVEAAFERGDILPAPFGVVFRGQDQVEHWLQMHYIALTEGMHLVEGRAEARVHVVPHGEDGAREEALSVAAGELVRVLRRHAVASVPLRRATTQPTLSTAFLVDRTRWEEFSEHVSSQARRFEELRVEQTGPWPPYDFVRMDLGA
jgi:hypothetical protein